MTVGRFRVELLPLVTEFRVRLINPNPNHNHIHNHNHNHNPNPNPNHNHNYNHNHNHPQGAAVTLGGKILGQLVDGSLGHFSGHNTA